MDDAKIKRLIRQSIITRQKLAMAILANYASSVSDSLLTSQEIKYWEAELSNCAKELVEIDKSLKL